MAKRGENIYKRKDGRWEGRYSKGTAENGKILFGYVYGRSYKETKEKLLKYKTGKIKSVSASAYTVKGWFDTWLVKQGNIKLSSKTIYVCYINKHISPKLGKIKLKNLNENTMQRFVDSLTQSLSPKTVHSIYTFVKTVLTEAYQKNYTSNVCINIRLPKMIKKDVIVMSKAEQKRLETTIGRRNNKDDIGVLLSLYTGLRIGEVCALKWEDIDFKNGTLKVNKTVYRVKNFDDKSAKTKVILSTPKSASSVRTIPLPYFLVKRLKEIKKESGFIIGNGNKPVETAVYARKFKKLLSLAKVAEMKYHTTRHSFSTRALEINMDIKTLSEILGHSTPTVTLNVYSHSLPEHKKKEMQRLGKIYAAS